MANKKITELTELTTPVGADIVAIVDDVAGTATTKKVTVTNLMGQAPVQSVNSATGAVVLDADDISDASTTNKFVTAADITKLGNLSGTNTGDQDLSSYQLKPAEGAFVDGDKTKLDGIDISAFGATLVDDADAAAARTTLGVDAAGTDNSTDVTLTGTPDYITLSGQEITVGQVDLSTDVTGSLPNSSVSGLGSLATANNVEGEGGVVSTGETGGVKFLREDGDGTCSWQVPTADVDTPLTTALRGTDNPHIGVYPNQSFKVIDNPYQSVMVVADEAGNLKLLNSLGVNNIAVGFSVVEDGVEPDIEVVSGSETYSVISGDSDTKGANGLPIRQGFNNPDIGANPSPILISGGSIA